MSEKWSVGDWAKRSVGGWAIPAVLAAGTAMSLFARFRAGGSFLAFFDDDYFYYLRIAQNIAAGGHSTFDGAHLTNGYHPLWMVVNVCLAGLFHGRAFFYALLAVIFACVLLTYAFAEQCFRRYMGATAARCCAALIATDGLMIMSGGMEIVLTLPLLALLCRYRVRSFRWQPGSAFLYGLLCSAVVLSRLDAALFVVMLAVFEIAGASTVAWKTRLRASAAFVAGSAPVLLYLAINVIVFGMLMPVSGHAKELRRHHTPSLLPFKAALFASWAPLKFFLVLPVVVATLATAYLLLRRGRERLEPGHRALVWALILFPAVHLSVLSILSDWPIWPWYLYPFVGAASGVSLVLFSRSGAFSRRVAAMAAPVIGAAFVALVATFSFVQVRNSYHREKLIFSMYFGAEDLRYFADAHPGIYGMGDRAGTPGFLVREPIVQLEGLVMDKPFLENIRHERDLRETLAAYGVRYYVATNPEAVGNCLRATEPMAAGPDSYVMRGTFCSGPVYQFFHNGYHTYVFDMEKELPGVAEAQHSVKGS